MPSATDDLGGMSWEGAQKLLERAADARRFSRPNDHYVPGRLDWPEEKRYQLQFHRSRHTIRAMFPGNGAGKTTVAGVEADYWLQHNHPYQPTPKWPVIVIWVCLKFQQMDMLREQLETTCLSPGWGWNEQKHRYEWPKGDRLYVISNDGDWGSIQGVPVDLVIIDEECDGKLWRELVARRRGKRQTRFVISATATKGKRWMYKVIYKPWLDFHAKLGLNEDEAMLAQKHKSRWVWPKGGLDDNPRSFAGDKSWYQEEFSHASPAEQQVRMRGGFVDLNAAPVFDLSQLLIIENKAAAEGIVGAIGTLEPAKVRKRPRLPYEFEFILGGQYQGGTITIFEEPADDTYVIGADFGEGLENRDFDEACVVRQSTRTQVASASGRWGDVHFAYVLFALGWFYNEAFLVGERQFGLRTMRRLYDEMDYTYQYSATDESHRAPRKSDLLGHHRTHGDLIIPRLQWAIAPTEKKAGKFTGKVLPPAFHFRDPALLEQLRQYQWMPKSQTKELVDATYRDLTCGAPPGLHDDKVMAAAYAVTGFFELPRFIKPEHSFPGGSMGDILGHAKVLDPAPKKKTAFTYGRRS
jgi:hypothetical protein